MAGDAMIAVSLAGTLFFAATTDAQRSNVALYLLVTMAPFAVLAPVIGPALDRLQRGRRWAIAVSHLGRAFLALVMMSHFDDFWLYPAALGVLVLSKSHNVLRAAVVPRVLPPAMSLTSANARLSVFGLATAGVAGALGAGIAAVLGFDWELGATACVFVVAGVLAVRLPHHVDIPTGEQPADVLTTAEIPVPGRRRVSPHVVLALRANAALRGLGGFLTIFLAFLVQDTFDGGWEATLALGGVAVAAGLGSFAGTAVGSRLHTAEPDRVVLISAAGAAAITVLAAFFYSFAMAVVVALVAAVTNALGKVSLDAIIQREVPGEPPRLGLRPVRDRAPARLGRRRRLRHRAAARPAGWDSPSPRRCSSSPSASSSGACTAAAARFRSRSTVSPDAADGAGGHVVVVRTAAPALLLLVLLAGCGGEPAGPGEVGVEVGAQDLDVRPTQYCLDGEGQRYDDHPADPRGLPRRHRSR